MAVMARYQEGRKPLHVFRLGRCDICRHAAWLHRLNVGPHLRTAWMCKECKRVIGNMLTGFGRGDA